ncbi:MAG: lysozyme inhibitor LprI family protein [Caulobacter sp.]|nr:lysozyme inhibitor LprI family protein [Caulobacter sp.]
MKTIAMLLALAGTLAATPALAVDAAEVEARYTPAFQTCLESPEGQSTMGIVQCIGAELEIQDAALNAAYRALIADMTPAQKAGVQKAQRAWIAFRDADCRSRYSPDWGSISTTVANMCVLQRTVERTIELGTFNPDWAAPADSAPAVGLLPAHR